MAFRFDMRDKTPQQQMVVSKRDNEDKLRKQEAEKAATEKSITASIIVPVNPVGFDNNHPAHQTDFKDFLQSIKCLTDSGVECRLSRLHWVEDVCGQSAAFLASDIQAMYKSRELIYQKADSPHKAGNYYNSLMLYYEFVHGKECPRINSKVLM